MNLCSCNSPYSLNCHVGAMLVFRSHSHFLVIAHMSFFIVVVVVVVVVTVSVCILAVLVN